MEDIYRIDESLETFIHDCPGGNPYAQDEFVTANDLKDSIQAKDFEKMVTICRRPIFSYIEIEIVKLIKRFAANPPAATVAFLNN